MKVLIIGSRVPFPLRDGGAIASYNLLKGLSESGIEVDYLSLNTLKHFVDKETCRKEFSFLHAMDTFQIDTSIKPLPAFLNFFGKSSYNIDRFTSDEFAQIIQNRINQFQYDVIHFEGLFVAQYLPLIEAKAPKILRQHNIEYKIWETLAQTEKNGLKRQYLHFLSKRLKKFEQFITPKFDAVVSITDSDMAVSKSEMGINRITSLPAGIEAKQSANDAINYKSIYHVGSMEWMPNQEAMRWFKSGIWPLIKKAEPEADFYMGGKNMPAEFKLMEGNGFHVPGEIQDMNTFTADKSILAVPLRSGSGIRIKTIEAMMSGKAVVTTSLGARGLPLTNDKDCLIADSESEFAGAVLKLIQETDFRNMIAENGKQLALSTYGNEAVSRKWLHFYEDLLRS